MDSFRSNQTQDYPIQFEEFSRGYIRYLYARSADSRASGSEGQDYLAWRHTDTALGFVICDGVGSSFCGNIAAKYLGEQLIKFLFDVGPTLEELGSTSALAEKAMGYLSDWREGGHKLVETVELPKGLPPLQLQALQQLRREQGSETLFVCGRLSFGERPKLVLIWMGDTEVRVFDHQGRRVEIGGLWRNSDRWSTKYGIGKKGIQAHAWMGDVEEHRIDRIIAFSDGLSVVADELHMLQDHELQETVGKQLMSSLSDDISFFDVRLKSPGGIQAPQELRTSDNRIVWPDVKGARWYQLEEAANGVFYESKSYETKKAEWSPDRSELQPEIAYRYYRVRACARKGSSQWSQALRLPPPPLSTPERIEIRDSPEDPGTYTISWSDVKGAQYYVLSEQFGPKHEREIYLGPERQYTVTRQESGTYRYRVQACGSAGQSDPSATYEKEVTTIPTVAGPDKTKGNISTEPEVRIISQEEAPSSAVELPQKVASMPVYESDRLKEATQARLEIRMGPRQDAPSPEAVVLDHPKLEEMEAVEINQPYTVRWSAVEGGESYELQVADDIPSAEAGHFSNVYEGPDLSFEEKGKEKDETYYYRVRAIGRGQRSQWSEWETITIALSLKPDVPQLYLVNNPSNDASYSVQWTHVPDADGYELEEKVGKLFPRSSTYQVGRIPSIQISGKQPGTYRYRVRAYNKKYGYSEYSNPESVEVKESLLETKLDPIENLRGKDWYALRWTPVKTARSYILCEARTPDFDEEEQLQCKSHYQILKDKEPGVYYYRVFSCDSKGKYDPKVPSNIERTEVILETPSWHRPIRCRGDKDPVDVKLSWLSVKWAEKYELVYVDISGDNPISEPTSNSCVVEMSEGTWDLRVRAVSRRNTKSHWSAIMRVTVRRDILGRRLEIEGQQVRTRG
jgi:hypothetical protein